MESIRALLILLFFLVLGCLLTAVQGNDANVTPQLLTEIKTHEKFVRLKHIMPVMSDQELGETLICRRPIKGQPVTLKKDYLQKLFVAKGITEVLNLVKLPEKIVVHYEERAPNLIESSANHTAIQSNVVDSHEKTSIDMGEIMLLINAKIEDDLKAYSPEVSVYSKSQLQPWVVNTDDDYELNVLPGMRIQNNVVYAKIGVYKGKKIIDRKNFRFDADIYVESLASTHDIEIGTLLRSEDISMQKIIYDDDIFSSIQDVKKIVGKVIKNRMKANTVFKASTLENPNIIERAEQVSVFIKGKGFEIKATGISQSEGKLGDMIEVLLKNSHKKVLCVVTGTGTVEVFH